MFVFDSLTNNLPSSISNFFNQCRKLYSYNTRNVNNGKLVVPVFKMIRYGKYSIRYQCTSEWNKLIAKINDAFVLKYRNVLRFNSFLDLNRKQFVKLIRKVIL